MYDPPISRPPITVDEVLARNPRPPRIAPLPPPPYSGNGQAHRCKVAFAVESMKRHMTDEGWQIMEGLGESGYQLVGYQLPIPSTDVAHIVSSMDPGTVVLQDKREWDVSPRDFREPRARFLNVQALRPRHDIFKLTILKDAQQRPDYHRQSAEEIGCHAWIIYYHPRIVHHLCPYTRSSHLLRTYHTLNPLHVPPYDPASPRNGCLLSGAVNAFYYPLRARLAENVSHLPATTLMQHPGYHRKGSATPGFLQDLSRYKVAICTASKYGYVLRKLIEATACGCRVVTDLPSDEVVPEIEGNLIRVHPDSTVEEVARVVRWAQDTYDPPTQEKYAALALTRYSHVNMCRKLAMDIDRLRSMYSP